MQMKSVSRSVHEVFTVYIRCFLGLKPIDVNAFRYYDVNTFSKREYPKGRRRNYV